MYKEQPISFPKGLDCLKKNITYNDYGIRFSYFQKTFFLNFVRSFFKSNLFVQKSIENVENFIGFNVKFSRQLFHLFL